MQTQPSNQIVRAAINARALGCNRTSPFDDESGMPAVRHPAQPSSLAPHLAAFSAVNTNRLIKGRAN